MEDKKTEISYGELMNRFDEIELEDAKRKEGLDINCGELFRTIYACYARVGEIVEPSLDNGCGLIDKDCFSETNEHLVVSIKTEKTHRVRSVYISKRKQPELCNKITKMLEKAPIDAPLFDCSTRWVQTKFALYFPKIKFQENVHLLRHWAATHYLQGYHTVDKPKIEHLALLGGWDSIDTLYKTYSHLRLESVKEGI